MTANGYGSSPTDLPSWQPGSAGATNGTAVQNGHDDNPDGHNGRSRGPRHGMVNFDAEQELRDRVSTRLTAEGGAKFEALDSAAQRLRKRTVALEELQTWVLHRTSVGLAAPSMDDEDALIEAVLASLGGLGRLEPLLLRGDVEDIFFNGTAPVILRLASGEKLQADPIAKSNTELRNLLQQLGTTLGDGSSREFSDARPLLALRLKAVGGGLGARLSAATDVTPNPVGTIRIHRHAEADLNEAYRLRMIDKPLAEFLRASVKAGLKVAIVGAMGHGKTFLLRSMAAELPLDAAIVTVEDERELGLHVLSARDAVGRILTSTAKSLLPPPVLDIFVENHLTPQLCEPEDIAGVVAFLASGDSAFITGEVIRVDGGMLSHLPMYAQLVKLMAAS